MECDLATRTYRRRQFCVLRERMGRRSKEAPNCKHKEQQSEPYSFTGYRAHGDHSRLQIIPTELPNFALNRRARLAIPLLEHPYQSFTFARDHSQVAVRK